MKERTDLFAARQRKTISLFASSPPPPLRPPHVVGIADVLRTSSLLELAFSLFPRFSDKQPICRGRICLFLATYCADQKSHSYRPLPNYSVGGEFTVNSHSHTHGRARARASARMGCAATGAHATDTHECLMPADSDFHPRRESAPPTSYPAFDPLAPSTLSVGRWGSHDPTPLSPYSPRCRT